MVFHAENAKKTRSTRIPAPREGGNPLQQCRHSRESGNPLLYQEIAGQARNDGLLRQPPEDKLVLLKSRGDDICKQRQVSSPREK
ncbi:MAG: hypothetical protein LBR51_06625 [Bacteroidales bacterium]|nr:hypothetical protein [Bacteroidales bacterium]